MIIYTYTVFKIGVLRKDTGHKGRGDYFVDLCIDAPSDTFPSNKVLTNDTQKTHKRQRRTTHYSIAADYSPINTNNTRKTPYIKGEKGPK